MFGNNRDQMRQFFARSWSKRLAKEAMEPLETLVADIMAQHPEYLEQVLAENAAAREFHGESDGNNPFLHMGMHITLAEQLSTDRPAGIRQLHQHFTRQKGDAHQAEHQMMECLGLILWEAQSQNRMPDEQAYLACLKRLLK